MTGAQLNSLINYKCGTNDTTFTPADKLLLVNTFKDEIASKIVELKAGYFLVPVHFNLVADQREYAFPEDMLNKLEKVEFKFASTDSYFPSTYLKDYLGSESEAEIIKAYTNQQGEFFHTIRRRALFVLSGTIISVTNGGRMWYASFPADLANLTGTSELSNDPTTTTFGLPRQFHELLARRVAIEYKGSKAKPIPLSPLEQRYESDLLVQLEALSRVDNSGEVVAEMPTSAELWDNGFNL